MSGFVSTSPEHESIKQAIDGISYMSERFRALDRKGDVDIAWIMARYARTVALPLDNDEIHLTDLQKLTYDLRIHLQEAWIKRGAGAEEIASVLMQWCVNAEATGVQALDDFVAELRSYVFPGPARVAS